MEWPYNYVQLYKERQTRLRKIRKDNLQHAAIQYYKSHPVEFINHWCVTYDPRNAGTDTPTTMPFQLFDKQEELVLWLLGLMDKQEGGLIEKSRDMGATWVCVGVSVWMFLFKEGCSIGWGSRKEMLVDRLGDPDSIFEKIRITLRYLPKFFIPAEFNEHEHVNYMKIINPENGCSITGEAGKNIGRGGRKTIYFKDESAHYDQAEAIEAALGDNTNVPVDISSVNGSGNIFYKKRKAKSVKVFIMDWRAHPGKTQEWYDKRRAKAEEEGLLHILAQEVDRDYAASSEGAIIPAMYVNAAIDAHIILKIKKSGIKTTALDVADEGGDKNALVVTHGIICEYIDVWAYGDTTVTSQRAFSHAHSNGSDRLIYDKIGVGAGVKGETNRLKKTDRYKDSTMEVTGFNAGSKKLYKPNQEFVPGSKNKDMFCNIKAQAWWLVRQRFVKTYNAVVKGKKYPHDELISICSNMEHKDDLVIELSQPKEDRDGEGKLKVQSKKDSTDPSQNIADAFIQAYLPVDYDTKREVRAMVV